MFAKMGTGNVVGGYVEALLKSDSGKKLLHLCVKMHYFYQPTSKKLVEFSHYDKTIYLHLLVSRELSSTKVLLAKTSGASLPEFVEFEMVANDIEKSGWCDDGVTLAIDISHRVEMDRIKSYCKTVSADAPGGFADFLQPLGTGIAVNTDYTGSMISVNQVNNTCTLVRDPDGKISFHLVDAFIVE